MKNLVLYILLVICVGNIAQTSPRQYLYDKADSLKLAGNFEQSRYYLELSLKQKGITPTDKQIKQEVILLDSSIAYSCNNDEFIQVIQKADHLMKEGRYIESLKYFDDASTLEPSYDYPHARIDQIIEESDEVRKHIMIYNAKQNQLSYRKILADIEELEIKGFFVEAYYQYKEFARTFHSDSLAKGRADKLHQSYNKEIIEFDSLIVLAESEYLNESFQSSASNFNKAKEINPKCIQCKVRLEHINLCGIDSDGTCEFDVLYQEAVKNLNSGKYQKAYYQFAWLKKKEPSNIEVGNQLKEIEYLLELETDERMRMFNADLTLEKANEAFMNKDYSNALLYYQKIKNAYMEVIDYSEFIELRISECILELEN